MNNLPYKIDPIEFAKKQDSFEGLLDLNKMLRLKSMCHPGLDLSSAKIWVEGNVDYEGLPYLHGTVVATLPLTCQRCLEVIHYPISAEFFLSPVFSDDEAERLPSFYEPLYLSDQTISLLEIIEDELLLDLPLVAKHEDKNCSMKETS